MISRFVACSLRCSTKYQSIISVSYSRFNRNPNLPTPIDRALGPDTDILLEQLKKCNSVGRVLELVDMHLEVMNSKHVVQCFESIHNTVKENREDTRNLQSNVRFQSLCSRLMKVVRLFEPQEVLNCYKALSELGVPSNTYLMQCVLKMLGAHLNSMSLGQLVFLNFLLHKARHDPLVDGLRLALPLVLQVQLDKQLDSDCDTTQLVNCLQLACRARLKTATVEKVLNAVKSKVSVLSAENAITVIFALLNLDTPVDGYKELSNAAFDIVAKNIAIIEDKKLLSILSACKGTRFYHHKFLLTAADHIVGQKWSLSNTYKALKSFSKLDFYPSHLLDHFAQVLSLEAHSFDGVETFSPLSCIEFMTSTSHKAAGVLEAASAVSSAKLNIIERMPPHLLIKFLSRLAIIGHFPPSIISRVMNENFLYDAWSSSKQQGRGSEFERILLTFFWAVDYYGEKHDIAAPLLHKLISNVQQRQLDQEYPLAKFIENGLGGSHFLQSGVFTRDGHVIDHVVAMRNNNYPVSLQTATESRERFIEDFILPEDAKIIAVIVVGDGGYCREPEVLRGEIHFKLQCLAAKNYATVAINLSLWKNLPDREKIPYLMREIKDAVQEHTTLSSKITHR